MNWKKTKTVHNTTVCQVQILNFEFFELVFYLAAANVFSKGAIDKIWSQVEKASYYYSAGFFLTTEGGPTAVEKVGKHASEAGKTYN